MSIVKHWKQHREDYKAVSLILIVWLLAQGFLMQRWSIFYGEGKGWGANLFNGFIGAAAGAGVAIWYAEYKENKREKRKRIAIASALYAELQENKTNAAANRAAGTPNSLLFSTVLTLAMQHVELFDSMLVELAQYREAVNTTQMLLSDLKTMQLANANELTLRKEFIHQIVTTFLKEIEPMETALIEAGSTIRVVREHEIVP